MSWLSRLFRREAALTWHPAISQGPYVEPEHASAGQIRTARFRVYRDAKIGRETPDPIRRIAAAPLPDEPAQA